MLEYLETKQITTIAQQTGAQQQLPPAAPLSISLTPFANHHHQFLPIGNDAGGSSDQFAHSVQQQHALHSAESTGQQTLIKTESQLQPLQLHASSSSPANNNELIGYYFGSISRETSEWILKTHGSQMDGAYLLRSSGPNDSFVLSLLVVHPLIGQQHQPPLVNMEVLHYKIVETEDSFVALHGQVGDEKFATIDELIDKAQGVATKPRWPVPRQSLESQILPPTYWGLTVDQVRLAILIKAKQWGFPMFSSLFQQQSASEQSIGNTQQHHILNLPNGNGSQTINFGANGGNSATTLNNETIRTLIYKSLHEFQPWFHGKISRDEAERRIDENGGRQRDGRFLVRERDNYSYAMCISHKKTTKHYRIDVLSTGELAIQDGRKFTSLMALISHYTIMSDGLWCALTEACPRPIQQSCSNKFLQSNATTFNQNFNSNGNFSSHIGSQIANYPSNTVKSATVVDQQQQGSNNLYCRPMFSGSVDSGNNVSLTTRNMMLPPVSMRNNSLENDSMINEMANASNNGYLRSDSSNKNGTTATSAKSQPLSSICSNQVATNLQIKAPIKEWLQTINHKWSQFISSKNQHQSLNSFLFGSSNPLNNHCRHHGGRNRLKSQHHHHHHGHNSHHHGHHHHHHRRKYKIDNQITIPRTTTCGSCNLPHSHVPIELAAGGIKNDAGNQVSKLNSKEKQPLSSATNMTIRKTSGCNFCNPNALPPIVTSLPINDQTRLALAQRPPLPLSDIINYTNADQSLNLQHHQLNNINTLVSSGGGFVSNGQSFIGSPLFAVKQTTLTNNDTRDTATRKNFKGPGSSGSTNSNSSSGSNNNNGNIANEEKLISPAQSISTNLNNNCNPYNSGTEIYKSAASTALIRDDCQLPTNSSSSSSGCKQTQHNLNAGHNNNQIQSYHDLINKFNSSGAFVPIQAPAVVNKHLLSLQEQQLQSNGHMPPRQHVHQQSIEPISHAGPIFCGQHAGPAFRYTNCTGNENLSSCAHRNAKTFLANGATTTYRAADDSQLMNSSTQLAGPAALTKFVQFQDGQCLRTHRDTRSIQMAYLLSKQANPNTMQQVHQIDGPMHGLDSMSANSMSRRNNQAKSHQLTGSQSTNHTGRLEETANHRIGNTLSWMRNQQQQQFHDNQQQRACEHEIDLIDCDGDGFDFKYDPKLIKSSSIETLCGIGEDDRERQLAIEDDLVNFKTNSELVMSLKPCWFANRADENLCSTTEDILCPIPACQTIEYPQVDIFEAQTNSQRQSVGQIQMLQNQFDNDQSSALSALMTEAANIRVPEEHYNSLKKKHDLDELTTNLLAELTASLKAQIDLKNKQSGLGGATTSLNNSTKQQSTDEQQQQDQQVAIHQKGQSSAGSLQMVKDPRELANEFDTLIQSNNG